MKLDLATVMVQWAAGGFAFTWVTTRRRELGIGYGWTMRIIYMAIGAIGVIAGMRAGDAPLRDWLAIAMILGGAFALVVSILRRAAGVSGQKDRRVERKARVAAMLGDGDLEGRADDTTDVVATDFPIDLEAPEFPPSLDLIAPFFGTLAVLASVDSVGGPAVQTALRLLCGGAFMGVISDAMLLGHWYLVQPGLRRDPLQELTNWIGFIWPFEVALMLWPTGMVQVLNGSIDDGWGGLLGWVWVVCALTTLGLVAMTKLVLREREYSAVMAATGLLYLAILTGFGTDLVARAVLNP